VRTSSSHSTRNRCELDSHADTCVAGSNTILISTDGRVVNVYSYTATKTADIPIATVATVWEAPDGERIVLIIHEALYFGDQLRTTLLTPNQMRHNGLVVDDVPRQFQATSTHSIYEPSSGVRIPLSIFGQSSGFVSHKPTSQDWNDCRRLTLTSDKPWNPNSPTLARAEQAVRIPLPELIEPATTVHHLSAGDVNVWQTSSQRSRQAESGDQTVSIYGDHDSKLYERIVATVNVATDDLEGNGLQGSADPDVYPSRKRKICQLSSDERKSVITPEILAKRFSCGLEIAKQTIHASTQSGIRNVYAPGERKVRQRLDHLRYPPLKMTMYSDTMFAPNVTATFGGHDAAQVYTNGAGYDFFIPITGKKNVHRTLQTIAEVAGVPHVMVTDGEGALRSKKWLRECRRLGMQSKITVPRSPWRNLAEASIRELKKAVRKAMRRSGSPRKLWNLCGTWCAAIRRITAMDKLGGRTPTEVVTGTTPDISQYALFDWYQPIRYLDPKIPFPNERKLLGRFVGVAENTTDEMAFVLLSASGKLITRKSVWAITDAESRSDGFKKELAEYDARIEQRMGSGVIADSAVPESMQDISIFDGEDVNDFAEPFELKMVRPELDGFVPSEAYDQYLNAEIKRMRGDELQRGTVIGRIRDQNGVPLGVPNANPLLDTREYQVRYEDGSVEELTANLINESIMSQVDAAGKHYTIFKEIIDHECDDTAVKIKDGYTYDKRGNANPVVTTKGWRLRMSCTDGSSEWIPLKDLKESHPLQVAEYAVCNQLEKEPAFAYWVRQVLRRRDRIIKKVKASVAFSKSTKFGIRVPRSVNEALAIDAETGTTFWRDALDKEMAVVRPAFQFNPLDKKPERGYRWIPCHMIFDIKPGLTRKARFVAGGHKTDPPAESVYSSVVSRDSIRIALMYASLNDLRVLIGDIQGAYLYARTDERIWTTCGPEFGSDQGRPAIIVLALYGLRSSGARWREQMASTLRDLGFSSCKADADVWMRESHKPSGERYWEYILMYVDDILCVSHDPQAIMDYIGKVYKLKEGSVKEPDTYLGAQIGKYYLPDDPNKVRWSMSSDAYLKRAVKEVERKLGEINRKLATRVTTPMAADYRPELDVTPELNAEQHNYFQGLIGVLRWACELGRIDILVDVTKLSHFLAAPRRGHLEQVFHIFAYLKIYDRSRLVLDDRLLDIDEAKFTKVDWSSYYPDAKEAIPANAPESLGCGVTTTCYHDADHAGCLATRRSHTGILLYVNGALVQWFSKRQNTVEAATFGSEFIAARIAVEMVEGLRYKLRMMGIPIIGPTSLLCDNQSVVVSSTRPESTLSKKHNSIAYHRVRESHASDTVRMGHVESDQNRSDMLTKSLVGVKLRHNCSLVLK
jgi:Reverse transcriptase (RNA-dependent DNA polymerase)